jgi:hypothetical protein
VSTYAGADWLHQCSKAIQISPFGRRVADLLGEWYYGLYHMDGATLADWSTPSYIQIRHYGELSTFDNSSLTRLVLLAHREAIRISISPRSIRYLTLMFHPRQSSAQASDLRMYQRHRTIEQAVSAFNNQREDSE